MNQNKFHKIANIIGLTIICVVLFIAFVDQLMRHDLPCPLCILQRVAFVAIGIGFVMNVQLGIKPSHYGLIILTAFIGLAIAIRQIYLHVSPNDLGYGDVIFGIHMYVWSSIAYSLIIISASLALLLEKGFNQSQQKMARRRSILIMIFLILILANGISTFIECGFLICPDNPKQYQLIGKVENHQHAFA